jgi:hypothetical protein
VEVLLVSCLAFFSDLKLEASCSSEKSGCLRTVPSFALRPWEWRTYFPPKCRTVSELLNYWTTQCYSIEGSTLLAFYRTRSFISCAQG